MNLVNLFNFTDEEKHILNVMLKMPDFTGITELKYSVRDTVLAPFQTNLSAFALLNKKVLLSNDTGTGKTFISMSVINCTREINLNMKWIFICPLNAVSQVCKDMEKGLYASKIITCDNKSENVYQVTKKSVDQWDVLVVSYEGLANPELQRYLFELRMVVKGLILDESHLLANMDGYKSNLIASMITNMEYTVFLSATPMRINIGQFVKQLYVLRPDIFEGKELGAVVNYFTEKDENNQSVGVRHLDILHEICFDIYMSRTRAELGIKGKRYVKPILAEYMEKYSDVTRSEILRRIKGDPDSTALKELVLLCKKLIGEGKRGLIYVNINDNKELVQNTLIDNGISCIVRDGKHTPNSASKEWARKKFVNRECPIMITNLTTSLNLPCDFVICYELTFDVNQLAGRGERGLSPRDMELYFIITKNTPEVSYFIERVYRPLKLMGVACEKDVSEVLTAYDILQKEGGLL